MFLCSPSKILPMTNHIKYYAIVVVFTAVILTGTLAVSYVYADTALAAGFNEDLFSLTSIAERLTNSLAGAINGHDIKVPAQEQDVRINAIENRLLAVRDFTEYPNVKDRLEILMPIAQDIVDRGVDFEVVNNDTIRFDMSAWSCQPESSQNQWVVCTVK